MPATPIPHVMAESTEAARLRALDASSKLAADVNAAADALDNLKRLLRRQFPDPVQARLQRAPGPLEATPTKQPWQLTPMMSAHALPQVLVAPLLPADPLHTVRRASGRLDIWGFLAGFALSAVIGALLYIYLAAG